MEIRSMSSVSFVKGLFLLLLIASSEALLPPSFCVSAARVTRPLSLLELAAQLGRVTMYKKETCPYCKKARELLEQKYGLELSLVDIEENPDKKEEILQQMRTFSGGRNTVPQIFFNADHLGGNDDVQKLDADGKLADLVEKVKTTEVSMMQEGWFHPWY